MMKNKIMSVIWKQGKFLSRETKPIEAGGVMEREPEKPYIYQSYGVGENNGYLWAISGIKDRNTEIKGLTKAQAERILRIILE